MFGWKLRISIAFIIIVVVYIANVNWCFEIKEKGNTVKIILKSFSLNSIILWQNNSYNCYEKCSSYKSTSMEKHLERKSNKMWNEENRIKDSDRKTSSNST